MVRDTSIGEDITVDSATPDPETWFEAVARAHNRLPLLSELTDGDTFQWDATAGRMIPAPSSGASSAPKRATRNTGDVAVSSTSYVAVSTALDLTVPDVSAGDVLEIGAVGSWSNNASTGRMDVVTRVAAADVNYVSGLGSAGIGVIPWTGNASVYGPVGVPTHYVVQAGDIEAGSVTLRLVAKVASGSKTLNASSASPFTWWARNLGAAA